MTQNNLGSALSSLGERESGTAKLEEAVVAYREALKELTRERVPLDWAWTQNNLGTALGSLGERESGTAKLEEAVAAYREALKEWTRERVPLEWAKTQHNLGNALWSLGERESGTAKLEEAVVAYREALTEQTRERVPLRWASSFGSEGEALMPWPRLRSARSIRRLKRCEMAVMWQVRRFMNGSSPGHALSSRGCAGGEVLHQPRLLS
jgi:tetratricopeptide (TPR) repeat protein